MKGIDKKACLDFLDIGLKIDTNSGLLCLEKIEYIIRTAVKIVGHRRLLILYFYSKKEAAKGFCTPTYTMFQASDTFVTYDHSPNTKKKWHTFMLINFGARHYCPEAHLAFYTKADEQRVMAFCKNYRHDGFYALYCYQQAIRDKATLRRQHKRQRKIIAEFQGLRPLPKDLDNWLRREVVPAYFFYDYRKGKRLMKGVCSACQNEFELEGVKHNAEGVCPCCGRHFTMKSNKKRSYIYAQVTASVVQRFQNDSVIVRVLKAYCWYPKYKPCELCFSESIREIIRPNGSGGFEVVPFHNTSDTAALTTWKRGYPPILYFNQYSFARETCGHLYCRNLKRELKGTPWQYCQLEAFYKGYQSQIEAALYLAAFQRIPAIEFFVKLGLFWLAIHVAYRSNGYTVINADGKNLREVLQIDPSDLPLLQRPGARVEELLLIRILRKNGHQPELQFFNWLASYEIISEVEDLECALGHTTPQKLMKYLESQFTEEVQKTYRGCKGALSDYSDYLGFCEQLEYDMTNEFVLFPKDMKAAHDQAMNLIKQHRVEKYDASIAALQPDLKRQYEFSADGFVVLPPSSAKEIVREGQALHHCVGGYVENMVQEKCVILFIRQEEDRDKSFYTVEVRDNSVQQVRGTSNCEPTPEVKAFLDQWQKKKHLKAA